MNAIRRSYILVLVTALAACGSDPADDTTADAAAGSGPAFTVTSKDVTIQVGEEVTYCYYFHTPNTAELAISRWSSDMPPGSHHMILFFGADNQPADGTLSTDNCGAGGGGASIPIWIYASQTPHGELALPTDDGTGKPLAMVVPANQPAYLQIHYLNASDAPITAGVTVDAYAYAPGTPYTQTATYITFNNSIRIPPHAIGHVERQSCATPPGAKFWQLTTHAHRQAVATDLEDGGEMLYASTDWEHPAIKRWDPPFLTFASSQLTYQCTYDNVGDNANNTIVTGPSAKTDEMCMGGGYYFPATAPLFCFDGQGPF